MITEMMKLFTYTLRKARGARRRVVNRLCPPVDPYTTHLPILVGLPRLRPVRRVLELGCGPHSTLTFLDRAIYPDLVELVSYETDLCWLEKLWGLSNHDPRLRLELVPEPMANTIAQLDLDQFDLVFVDDSVTSEGRAASIRTVLSRPFRNPWVVLHDMENPAYRAVVPATIAAQAFDAFTPHTWVVWSKDESASADRLARLAEIIRGKARRHRPERRGAWANVVTAFG